MGVQKPAGKVRVSLLRRRHSSRTANRRVRRSSAVASRSRHRERQLPGIRHETAPTKASTMYKHTDPDSGGGRALPAPLDRSKPVWGAPMAGPSNLSLSFRPSHRWRKRARPARRRRCRRCTWLRCGRALGELRRQPATARRLTSYNWSRRSQRQYPCRSSLRVAPRPPPTSWVRPVHLRISSGRRAFDRQLGSTGRPPVRLWCSAIHDRLIPRRLPSGSVTDRGLPCAP